MNFEKYCHPFDDDYMVTVGIGDCLEYLQQRGILDSIANDLYLDKCGIDPVVKELREALEATKKELKEKVDFINSKEHTDSWSTRIMALKDREIAWYREKYNNEYALR